MVAYIENVYKISCVNPHNWFRNEEWKAFISLLPNLYRLWRIPKNNIKIAACALNFYSLFAFTFCLLIFQMISNDKNGMRRMQRKFRSRYAINICYPKFRSAWTLALEKWDFFYRGREGSLKIRKLCTYFDFQTSILKN